MYIKHKHIYTNTPKKNPTSSDLGQRHRIFFKYKQAGPLPLFLLPRFCSTTEVTFYLSPYALPAPQRQ